MVLGTLIRRLPLKLSIAPCHRSPLPATSGFLLDSEPMSTCVKTRKILKET